METLHPGGFRGGERGPLVQLSPPTGKGDSLASPRFFRKGKTTSPGGRGIGRKGQSTGISSSPHLHLERADGSPCSPWLDSIHLDAIPIALLSWTLQLTGETMPCNEKKMAFGTFSIFHLGIVGGQRGLSLLESPPFSLAGVGEKPGRQEGWGEVRWGFFIFRTSSLPPCSFLPLPWPPGPRAGSSRCNRKLSMAGEKAGISRGRG